MDYIDPKKITYLPNTAGCFNSKEALRTLRLAREIGGWKLVKLEVLGDKKNLLPEMIETLKSTEVLTKEGFKVMVYCNDDNKFFLSPKTSSFTNFHPPISLANLKVLNASLELKQPAVLGKYVIFFGSI